jgi:RimJ/RimL family protein N-acetyltransferase
MHLILNKISLEDREIIKNLVTDYDVMKYIGSRKTWDENQLNNFMKYTLEEYRTNSEDNLYMKILSDNIFIGLVGIHKYSGDNEHSLTVMIGKKYQNKGLGTKAIELILDEFHKLNDKTSYIVADTLETNIKAQKSLTKVGFIRREEIINHSGKNYKRYHYNFNLHHIIKYDYPYLSYFMTESEMLERFRKLQHYKQSNDNFKQREKGKFGYDIIINYDIDKEYNRITDWFTDICRARCIFKGVKLPPYDYYKKHKGIILGKSLKNNKFDYDKFEDTIYNSVKMCNNFQLTIIMNIYQYFNVNNNTKILDSSAGWGDRLIAAIACGANYTGVDPSECLAPLYQKIIRVLSNKNLNYKVISKPFEKISKTELGNSDYDISFTSPPFYDLEVYNDDNTQSIIGYKTQSEWIKNFLNVLADINIHYLKIGGYFIIYVPEYKEFIEYMENRKDLEYYGDVVYYYTHDNSKKRKIMVWKKIL